MDKVRLQGRQEVFLFRSILALGGLVLGAALLDSCAATRPEDVPVPAPVLSKTVWDDASGRSAPADSIGRNLIMLLGRRDDLVASNLDLDPTATGPRAAGNGAGHHKGPHHGGGGGMMPGESEYGAGGSELPHTGEQHRTSSLRLLLAGSVERWDVDSERTALEASPGSATDSDSAGRGSIRLSVRLVNKATGRVVWRKSEECSANPSNASVADGTSSSSPGWKAQFQRCREEILRSSARDVAQAALDLARKAAISEAEARPDR